MDRKSLAISLVVGGTFLMENIDGTVITTAMPDMAKSFGTDPIHMSIGVSSYIIMLAAFIPVSGWVAERFGVRRVFGTAILGFTLSSILCGLSPNLAIFTLTRIIQGFFGALMVPVGRLTVLRNTAKKDLVSAIAYITWPGLVGPIIGPFLGGFITTYFSWHWIFFINIPLGILAYYLAMRFIPKSDERSEEPLDVKGFILCTSAMIGFMVGLEAFSNHLFATEYTVVLVLLSIVLFFLYYKHSNRVAKPMIDLGVLRIRTFAVTIYSGSLIRIIIGIAPFLTPLMFQVGFGLDAFQAGSLLMATMVGNLAMKPISVWVIRKWPFKSVLLVTTVLMSVGSLGMAYLFPDTPVWMIVFVLFFCGMARSMEFSCLNTLAFADVETGKMHSANALYSTVQQMTLGLGVTSGALMLQWANFIHGGDAVFQVADFQLAFLMAAVLGLVTIFEFLKLKKDDGDHVRGLRIERHKDKVEQAATTFRRKRSARA